MLIAAAAAWKSSGGTVNPKSCADNAAVLCGTVPVPLDRSEAHGKELRIAFRLYPHTDTTQPSLGAIVASVGGPGYASTNLGGFFSNVVFAPLRSGRDIIAIDQRGTGLSQALDCRDLQHGVGDWYTAAVSCGRQLGTSSDLYGTADVADDVDAVRTALGIEKMDYYGYSYGAVDVQVYALRHGEHLRTAILDSPAGIAGNDPWFRGQVVNLVKRVALVCQRSASCANDNPTPEADIAWLAAALRRSPVDGDGYDADGDLHHLHVTEASLDQYILWNDAGDRVAIGEIAAAAESLGKGDNTPLLRLAAEADFPAFFDNGDPSGFSAAVGQAATCTDLQFQWDKNATPAQRQTQYNSAFAALPSQAFFPFSKQGWAIQPFEPDPCIGWPAPTHRKPSYPADTRFPAVPTLVLAGDLDPCCGPTSAKAIAAQFPKSSYVEIANSGHITIFNNTECSSAIIVNFVQTLQPGDTSCAQQFTPLRAVGSFWRTARDADPAAVDSAGINNSTRSDRQIVSAAWAAAADAIQHGFVANGFPTSNGTGLRGGTYTRTFGDNEVTLQLSAIRFTTDVTVSGSETISFNDGTIDATLDVTGPNSITGQLHITGTYFPHNGALQVTGQVGGRAVAAQVPTA